MNPRVRTVVRSAVLTANTPLARRRAGRAIEAAARPFRLEIGGLAPREGWVVTNVNAVTRNYLDATVAWPVEDGALELVYADNVIEHLTLPQGRTMLAEAFRCLRPGGRIRVVTPDLRKHVDAYLAGPTALDDDLTAAYREIGLTVEHPVDLVRIPVESFGHHLGYVYDVPALTAELEAAGFVDVQEQTLGHSETPGLSGLDQRTDEGPAQMALEAGKPA